MARKKDGLTPRQRQSQQIMREKSAKKKRKAYLRKIGFCLGALTLVSLTTGGVWLWKSGTAMRSVDTAINGAYHLSAQAGFSVQSLYLEGRNRTAMEEINQALSVKKGDPILQISLSQLRTRLEKIESVKLAAIERALPGTLYVRIVEREPVALWQHQGKLALVDDNGAVMNDIDSAHYANLPLIIGDGAPKHVGELMALLATQPELAKRFSSAIRISDRRWNIRMNGGKEAGVEVRLPESDPVEAWKKLAQLQSDEHVLDRDINVIDLRLEGKMFIKGIPATIPAKAINARET